MLHLCSLTLAIATRKLSGTLNQTLSLVLQSDNKQLDEVVVVGYAVGTQRYWSQVRLNAWGKEGMNKGVVTSAQMLRRGKRTGVVISRNGGDPMGEQRISRVRGISSLVVMILCDHCWCFCDMTMFQPLAQIDIESMTILERCLRRLSMAHVVKQELLQWQTTKGKNGFANISYNGNRWCEQQYSKSEDVGCRCPS